MNLNLGSLGTILAITALILAIVFFAVGQLPLLVAGLVVLLALAQLLR